jgi:hypothetical protein
MDKVTITGSMTSVLQQFDIFINHPLKVAHKKQVYIKWKMVVFWVVVVCSLVEVYPTTKVGCSLSLVKGLPSTRLYSATTQKTAVFVLTTMRASVSTHIKWIA